MGEPGFYLEWLICFFNCFVVAESTVIRKFNQRNLLFFDGFFGTIFNKTIPTYTKYRGWGKEESCLYLTWILDLFSIFSILFFSKYLTKLYQCDRSSFLEYLKHYFIGRFISIVVNKLIALYSFQCQFSRCIYVLSLVVI